MWSDLVCLIHVGLSLFTGFYNNTTCEHNSTTIILDIRNDVVGEFFFFFYFELSFGQRAESRINNGHVIFYNSMMFFLLILVSVSRGHGLELSALIIVYDT